MAHVIYARYLRTVQGGSVTVQGTEYRSSLLYRHGGERVLAHPTECGNGAVVREADTVLLTTGRFICFAPRADRFRRRVRP